jgi:hypothetical protein
MNVENPTTIMIKFDGSIDLCNSSLKSISGFADRLSISMNNSSDTTLVVTKPEICIVDPLTTEELFALLLLLPVSKYVSTSRNEVIVIAKVIAPFMSMVLLLPYFLLLL